eukprot:3286085-Amphidinium_carterae.1
MLVIFCWCASACGTWVELQAASRQLESEINGVMANLLQWREVKPRVACCVNALNASMLESKRTVTSTWRACASAGSHDCQRETQQHEEALCAMSASCNGDEDPPQTSS